MSLGAALFKENNCFDCHKLNGIGGDAGPALDDVGGRLDVGALKKRIKQPEIYNQNTSMPSYSSLSESDLQALADFLAKQKGAE